MPTRSSPRSPLWRLQPLIRAHALKFWGGLALIINGRFLEAGMPLLLGIAVDSLNAGVPNLTWPALGILALMAMRYLSFSFGRRFVRQVGAEVAYDLRQKLYWHLELQGPRFFAKYSTGDLMARAINDLQLIRMMIGLGSRLLLVLGASGVIAFSVMMTLSSKLALMLLPLMPFIGFLGWLSARKIFIQSNAVQEGFSELSAQVQENLNGIRTIQTHSQEDREISRLEEKSSDYADEFQKLMFYNSALTSTMLVMTGAATLIIVGYGGSLVMNGEVSIGTFTAFIFFLGMMLSPVKEGGVMVTLFQRAASASSRIFAILDHEPEIKDADEAEPLEGVGGTLSINHLSYRHPEQEEAGWPALDNVSLTIERGQTIAILGRVGSGKSTLLRLLVRLLDPPPGTVYLDGQDVRMLPLAQVRQEVSFVPQDPFLFADQLGQNISYDNPERSQNDVWDAAQTADLDETITSFPAQLETAVGERGVTLSGGQKQRTSLARGLIRGSPVLLLDDCFSAVDTETEEKILSQLRSLRKGLTTVLVSHRVSTAQHADRIFVLDHGKITEEGDHASLMALGGAYAELARLQSRRDALKSDLDAQNIPTGEQS
jgi:ATP-binding cassette, subfamily B, multidrug efflux pump